MKAFYTGVGSRETPAEVMEALETLAGMLSRCGWTLRSGGAEGADTAFESGAGLNSVIFLPWRGFNGRLGPNTVERPTLEAYAAAKNFHPAWGRLGVGARAMHARNCHQVLGLTLSEPSHFVVCWTPDGCESESERTKGTGGTATAIAVANRRGIPVFNLQRRDAVFRLTDYLAL